MILARTDQFTPNSPAHFAAVAVTALVFIVLLLFVRRASPGGKRRWAVGLAIANSLTWPFGALAHGLEAYPGFRENLFPLHLCDLASLTAVVALITESPRARLLTYLFGMAGTLQGLLTPSLTFAPPNPIYFSFFYHHGIVVITALLLPLGFGWQPHVPLRRALWSSFIAVNIYAATVFLVNLVCGTNYAFLREKPPGGSLLDQLGPWPYYIGVLELVCVLAFLLLLLPFGLLRKRTV